MKLTPNVIKRYLAIELQKQGATLQDLEEVLGTADTIEKTAENMEKRGLDLVTPLKSLGTLAKAYGLFTVGAGALGGGLGYTAYLANQNSSDQQAKKIREAQEYQTALKSLHDSYAQDQLQPS
jgi:hypothetical protein